MPPVTLLYALTIVLPLLATAVAFWAGGWWRRLYVGGARLLLGALMLGGGLYKLSDNHLPGLMGPPMDHAFLAKHSLEIFARFIGVAQLLIGLLLLTGRFALLGALMLVPMWVGIVMLTWSQHWTGTPYLTLGFLILTLGLLLHDYHRLKYVLYPPAQPETIRVVPLRTGPRSLEALWWLGVAVFMGGSLLYPVSLRMMVGTMLAGLLLLLAAGGLLLWRRRTAAAAPGV
ncbi:DoxX family membrane protein [Hymenobacter sp. APR13]|uniref:DoxX family membrane protein n=1 Tax=Hymenobacter sp. APR13 TaxID=1356852 RepID=UPI0009DD3597|nr:DoxX family membrane protein [Hymenobacter sp. APR13]